MNYFFGIKNDKLRSKLSIPRFKNRLQTRQEYLVYKAVIEEEKWKVKCLDDAEMIGDFYVLDGDIVDNRGVYFLATPKQISMLSNIGYSKLVNLNDFTDTEPAFRANLQVSINHGGFSSYQSEYPYRMITGRGSILSPVNVISNKDADENILFIKNIYELPIQTAFDAFFVDIKTKKVMKRESIYTNYTNEIVIDNSFVRPGVYLYTEGYIGVPMVVSIHNKHISFEHTHPPHEYVLSEDRFQKVSDLKREIGEIIR